MRFLRALWLVAFAVLMLGAVVYSNAQQGDATCPTLIEQALTAIGNNCGDLNRNNACYGYQDVNATFTEPTSPEFFSRPSDRAELISLKNIGTSPLDTALAVWGIALMSVQANLPDTLPGQNAVFMLLGNTQVENAVHPEDVFAGGAVIDVTTSASAGLFYRPDTSDQIVGAVPGNTTLSADAITADGEWVRVVFNGVPGWLTREVLLAQDTLDSLPVISPDAQTPMQSFYLRTGITGTQCTEAPDSLVVQGPQSLKIDINVDGADIRLGSTIALRLIPLTPELAALYASIYPDINQVKFLLELDVIDGRAVLNPGTPDEIVVEEGFRTVRCLSEPENLGLDGVENDRAVFPACPWLQPERWRQIDLDTYIVLDGLDLNYPIHMPDLTPPTDTPTPTRTPVPYVPPRPTRTPTVTDTVIPFDVLTDTPTPTYTLTNTPTYTLTSTLTPTNTDTLVPTATPTNTDTPVPTPTPTDTVTPEIIG